VIAFESPQLWMMNVPEAWRLRNLVCGAIVTPMEGAYGNQKGHPGRFAGGV
jgi:hypothetical protein